MPGGRNPKKEHALGLGKPKKNRRAEHEGRVPQPGVPAGPRNQGTVTKSGTVVPYEPPQPTRQQREKKIRALIRPAPSATDTARYHYQQAAAHGVKPPLKLKYTHPKTYKKAEEARIAHIAKQEGLKEDPLAEFVIDTAATAGLGAGAKLGSTLAKGAAEKFLASAGEKIAATGTSAAEEAAEKGLKAIVKGAPKKAAKAVKEAPAKKVKAIKSAPRRAKATAKDLKTSEGRVRAAKGSGRAAARHPVRTGYGAAVALPEGVLPGDVTKRARAFAEGTANAVIHHPEETAKTTLRALPAAIVGPAELGAAAVDSAIHGTPKPLVNTAKSQAEGVAHIAANAFSGDVKKAEEAARKEGSVTFLTPLPALSKTKLGKGVTSEIRDVSSGARRALATTDKLPAKEWRNARIRHAPKGTEEHTFALSARHHQRKRTAETKARIDNPHRVAIAHHHNDVTSAAAKVEKKFQGAHTTHQVLAEYGIRTPEQAKFLREHGPGDPALIKALDWLDKHPDYFHSQGHAEVMAALERNEASLPAKTAGKGERARLLQQGDMFGIPRPEQVVPHAKRAVFGDGTWVEARDRLKQLREKQQAALEAAPAAAKEAIRGDIKRTEKMLKEAKKEAKGRKLGRQRYRKVTVDGVKKKVAVKPYDDKALKEYVDRVEAARKQGGYAKAIWTSHAGERGGGLENPFPAPMGNLEHMREGRHATEGKLDRSLEGLVRGTVHLPRLKASAKEVGRGLTKEKLPYTWDGQTKYVIPDQQTWDAITSPRTKDNPNGGQYDPKSVGRFAVREVKNAINDPFMGDAERAGKLDSILAEAESGQVRGHAPSLLLPREVIREARAQITPPKGGALNATARMSSRLLLGTSPAWAVSQIFAEGIPLLMAKPSLVAKGAGIEKFISEYSKKHPEDALSIRATAGASPIRAGANLQPRDIQETYTPQLWENGAKALTRGKSAKAALSFVKLEALGRFDVRRQNEYRTLLYAAKADKHLQTWHSGLTNLFDAEARISKKFKTREEVHQWLEHDPQGKIEKARIEKYVDDMQGNWTAFTRFEMKYAPAVLFYPFLRYSIRWPLWAFPKNHPIRATIAYMLGQANANQLEQLVGGPLQNPIAYAYPAWQGVDNKTQVLPGGSRISPGQSNITEAFQSGNPANVLSSLNPALGAGITATTGVEPFTGAQVQERGKAAIEGLLELPRPMSARVFGGKNLTELITGNERSTASQAYAQYDPLKEWRSLAFPGIPQTEEQFKKSDRLAREFSKKYGEGRVPGPFDSKLVQDLLYGGPGGKPQPEKLPEVLRKIHQSEAAGDYVKKAEAKFNGPSEEFGDVRKKLLEAVENAWETRGKKAKKEKNPYLEALEEPKGNVYLEALEESSSGNPYLEALK